MPKRTTILTRRVPTDHADAASRDSQAGETPTTGDVPTPVRAATHDAVAPLGTKTRPGPRRRILRMAVRVLTVALVLLLFAAVVAPYVYIHLIAPDPPKPLTFQTTNSTPTKSHSRAATGSTKAGSVRTPAGVAGTWSITAGSTVGYRVNEMLVGQHNTAVGRTTTVTGHLTISNRSVRSAAFTVDVTKISSDAPGRDGSYATIMDTATFPTAAFTLTAPITLVKVPADLVQVSVPVIGNLTLHGVTKPVTFQLKARRNGATIEVNGSIPITFSDYQIPNPSLPGISVDNKGELEFLLTFARRTTRQGSAAAAPTDRIPSR
jgi:polyisoprenoid-binding protein YceI